MKSRWYLLFVLCGLMFVATPLFAEGTPQPGVIDPSDDGEGNTQQCYLCRGSYDLDTGEGRTWCGKPDSGSMGATECELTAWTDFDNRERLHCWTFGNSCCVY